MSKCGYIECDNDVSGRQVFCSDKCRMARNRTTRTDEPEQIKTNTKVEHYPEPPVFKGKSDRVAWIMGRSRSELRRMLNDWRLGQGTEYQRRMGELAAFYEPGKYVRLEQLQAEREATGTEQQSYSPMMVGYVPPQE
jgi:hypothetical protein